MKHIANSLILLLLLILPTAGRAVTPFRFAQLTDVHLNPNGDGPTKALMQSIDEINRTDSIDFVLVTGDLSEQGDRATLEKTKHCLDQLTKPYYVCMGNHETTWSESGCTAYSEIYGPEMFELRRNGVQFLFFNSGPLLKMAYGHVSPSILHWASERLREAKRNGLPTIIITHYPIMEGDVDNWYAVTDSLRRTGGVRLFIGGHYHALRQLSYDGMPGILMRSNLPDKEGRSGYGIYEVTPSEIRAYVKTTGGEKRFLQAYTMTHPVYDPAGRAEKYPDYSDNRRFRSVRECWASMSCGGAGAAIYCSPAVWKDRVIIGTDAGTIEAYALRDGKPLWSFRTGARVVGNPAIDKGIVVCGSADKHIYGLDAKSGTLLWKLRAGAPVLGSVVAEKGIAYVGASDSCFRAIEVGTGKTVWQYRGLRGYVMTRPLLTHNKVIFGAWDNTLYCLSRDRGAELWRWTGGLTRMHFSPAQCWPVESHGKVFICDPQRAMTCINMETGQTVWRSFASKVRESIGISRDGKRVYFKTMQDSVVCYATAPKNPSKPEELWATNVGFGYEIDPCMLIERDGIVYGSTHQGLVYALEGKSGRLLWRHKVSNGLVNTVLPIGRGKVLYTNTDGRLGLLEYTPKP